MDQHQLGYHNIIIFLDRGYFYKHFKVTFLNVKYKIFHQLESLYCQGISTIETIN